MSQEKISEAAKAGHPQAIATMINKSLEPKNIVVKSSSSNGCLTLIAESQTVPSQDFLVDYLKQGLNNLKPANISRVIVRGRITGQTTNVWQASFNLGSPKLEGSKNQSQTAVTTNSATTSHKSVVQEKISSGTSSSKKQKLSASLNFAKSRSGERVIIAVGSSLVTSILCFSIFSLGFNKDSRFATASNRSMPVAIADPSPQTSTEKSGEKEKSLDIGNSGSKEQSLDAGNSGSDAQNFIKAYLEKIVSGEDGDGYFCEQDGVSTFFSPRNFQILKAEMYDSVGQAIVRLDSSNKGGSQITQTWLFMLKKGRPQYAALLGKAGEYGICINLVTAKE